MSTTLAFDVYGTLIDTHGVSVKLDEMIGGRAKEFSLTWREKQLEYSFRRGLMQNYATFAVCTRHALDYTCAHYNVSLSKAQKQTLLESYRTLPAFADAKSGLACLKKNDFRLYAFSNGTEEAVETLLVSAGLREFFQGVVSVDELKSFKPNPAVYSYFLRKSASIGSNAWLISSNPFDVIGAISAGMRAAWIRRSKEALFDPWGIAPTITAKSILDLAAKISDSRSPA